MSTMRIVEHSPWSRPGATGSGSPRPLGHNSARPRAFAARPLDVRALVHDGSSGQARAISQWVSADASSPPATAYLDRDGVTVLIHVPGELALLRVAPGQYLVHTRHPDRWRTYDAEEFESFFAPRPREMPIFADGEVTSE